jgi:monovalent cation/hydrogen antiporter
VAVVTLVLQGLTLRWLLARLGLQDDGAVEREAALARRETAEAALRLVQAAPPSPAAARLAEEYAARANAPGPDEGRPGDAALASLQARAVAEQRRVLAALRSAGRIGDDAFHLVEEEIDLLELSADPRLRRVGAAG